MYPTYHFSLNHQNSNSFEFEKKLVAYVKVADFVYCLNTAKKSDFAGFCTEFRS